MKNYSADVKQFHDKFGFITPNRFTFLPDNLFDFRVKFFHEELDEYIESIKINDLGTAIDSLIDLVYICCGTALYHGIQPYEFEEVISEYTELFPNNTKLLFNLCLTNGLIKLFPELPSQTTNDSIILALENSIKEYVEGHKIHSSEQIKSGISAIYVNCCAAAALLGVTTLAWIEFWNDVHRANMSKVKTLSTDLTKRGQQQFDVRKPDDWISPRTEEILSKYKGSYESY